MKIGRRGFMTGLLGLLGVGALTENAPATEVEKTDATVLGDADIDQIVERAIASRNRIQNAKVLWDGNIETFPKTANEGIITVKWNGEVVSTTGYLDTVDIKGGKCWTFESKKGD